MRKRHTHSFRQALFIFALLFCFFAQEMVGQDRLKGDYDPQRKVFTTETGYEITHFRHG